MSLRGMKTLGILSWLILAACVQWHIPTAVSRWTDTAPPGLMVLIAPVLSLGILVWFAGIIWGIVLVAIPIFSWFDREES